MSESKEKLDKLEVLKSPGEEPLRLSESEEEEEEDGENMETPGSPPPKDLESPPSEAPESPPPEALESPPSEAPESPPQETLTKSSDDELASPVPVSPLHPYRSPSENSSDDDDDLIGGYMKPPPESPLHEEAPPKPLSEEELIQETPEAETLAPSMSEDTVLREYMKLVELSQQEALGEDYDEEWIGEEEYMEIPGEYMEVPAESPSEEILPLEISQSEEDFIREYMKIPESPAKEALSREALRLEFRDRQPSILKFYPDGTTTGALPPGAEDHVSTLDPRMYQCPSIESFFKLKTKVDVHFFLYPGHKMVSKECRLDTTIYQLKMAIGRYVKVPAYHLDMRKSRNLIGDNKMLYEIGGRPQKKIKFTVEINKRIAGEYEITIPKDHVTFDDPDTFRRIKIEARNGTVKYINMSTVQPTEIKPMLGGFIDQRNHKAFHHAATSMDNPTPRVKPVPHHDVAVQAFKSKATSVQTALTKSQQTEKKCYYISDVTDKILLTRKYVTVDEVEVLRWKSAIQIQRYWRRWLAIRERKRRMEGLINRVKWAEDIRKGRLEQRLAIMNEEIQRQQHPTRMVDLELIYRAINDWRKEEEEFISKNRWGPERKAALVILATLESDLLLNLERTRNNINVQQHENRNMRIFEKMGEPRRWLISKTTNFITVDDGEKVHVRTLKMIYTQLKKPSPHTPEGIHSRCHLLGELSEMIKKVNTKMGEMLTDLIKRELIFLSRPACSQALLCGIRKRIATTFFFLCQDPNFNKESKRVQKVPWDPMKLRKDMVQCKGCRRMQYRDEFTIVKGTTVTSRCHTCMNLYRTAILRIDLNLYRHMLKELRRDELAAGVVNSVSFLIDAFDLQFLVEQIWHAQSALSGIDNRYLLRLCRWNKHKPWAPWNCVLLTEEEANAHLQLENIQDAYKGSFFHKVVVKQTSAKTYFEGLAKLGIGLDARVEENCRNIKQRALRSKMIREKLKKKARLANILGS